MTEYTLAQLDSARATLEMFAKHVREYMAKQGEWEVFDMPASQSALPQHMSTVMSKTNMLGFPIIQAMASLLGAILKQTDHLPTRYYTCGCLTSSNTAHLSPRYCRSGNNGQSKIAHLQYGLDAGI